VRPSKFWHRALLIGQLHNSETNQRNHPDVLCTIVRHSQR
jgi:hypothetical protein